MSELLLYSLLLLVNLLGVAAIMDLFSGVKYELKYKLLCVFFLLLAVACDYYWFIGV